MTIPYISGVCAQIWTHHAHGTYHVLVLVWGVALTAVRGVLWVQRQEGVTSTIAKSCAIYIYIHIYIYTYISTYRNLMRHIYIYIYILQYLSHPLLQHQRQFVHYIPAILGTISGGGLHKPNTYLGHISKRAIARTYF